MYTGMLFHYIEYDKHVISINSSLFRHKWEMADHFFWKTYTQSDLQKVLHVLIMIFSLMDWINASCTCQCWTPVALGRCFSPTCSCSTRRTVCSLKGCGTHCLPHRANQLKHYIPRVKVVLRDKHIISNYQFTGAVFHVKMQEKWILE